MNNSRFIVLVVIAATLWQVTCCRSLAHLWKMNLDRSSRFKCGKPQPRAMEFRYLVDDAPAGKVFPPSTVLHRCESAGCCNFDEICTATDSNEIELVFVIVESSRRYHKTIRATNHTECGCRKK